MMLVIKKAIFSVLQICMQSVVVFFSPFVTDRLSFSFCKCWEKVLSAAGKKKKNAQLCPRDYICVDVWRLKTNQPNPCTGLITRGMFYLGWTVSCLFHPRVFDCRYCRLQSKEPIPAYLAYTVTLEKLHCIGSAVKYEEGALKCLFKYFEIYFSNSRDFL